MGASDGVRGGVDEVNLNKGGASRRLAGDSASTLGVRDSSVAARVEGESGRGVFADGPRCLAGVIDVGGAVARRGCIAWFMMLVLVGGAGKAMRSEPNDIDSQSELRPDDIEADSAPNDIEAERINEGEATILAMIGM